MFQIFGNLDIYISETTTVFSRPEHSIALFIFAKILILLEQCISCFTMSSCLHVQPFECSIFYYYKSTSLLFETEDFFVNLHQLLNNLLLSLQHIPSKRLNYANRFVHIVKTSRLADDHDPQVWWLLYYPIKNWPQLSKQVCKKKLSDGPCGRCHVVRQLSLNHLQLIVEPR